MFFPVLDRDSKLKLPFSKVSSQRAVVKMTMFAVHPMTASLSALLCLEMTCWLLRLPQGLSFCGGGTDRLPPYLAAVAVTLCQLPSLKNHPGTMVWVMSTLCFVGGGSPGKNTISQVSGLETRWCLMFSLKTPAGRGKSSFICAVHFTASGEMWVYYMAWDYCTTTVTRHTGEKTKINHQVTLWRWYIIWRVVDLIVCHW